MMERFRAFWTGIFAPVGNLFLRWGVSPDVVTVVGTLGVSAGALIFFPQGQLLIGVLVITAFVFSDMIDGYMARQLGRSSKWGAFLDSTMDRFGDAAVFGGLVLYFLAGPGDSVTYGCLALLCLVLGSITSYARARAESLGMHAKGGIAERADRLVAVLVMTGLSDLLGLPWLLYLVLWVLAAASAVTVVQRMKIVYDQTVVPDPTDASGPTDASTA